MLVVGLKVGGCDGLAVVGCMDGNGVGCLVVGLAVGRLDGKDVGLRLGEFVVGCNVG